MQTGALNVPFFLRGLFGVEYAANQPRLVEQVDDQLPVEPGCYPPIEHLLDDIVDDIVQKVIKRVFEKDVLFTRNQLNTAQTSYDYEQLTTTDRIT